MKQPVFASLLITCAGALKGLGSDCKGNELTLAKVSSLVESWNVALHFLGLLFRSKIWYQTKFGKCLRKKDLRGNGGLSLKIGDGLGYVTASWLATAQPGILVMLLPQDTAILIEVLYRGSAGPGTPNVGAGCAQAQSQVTFGKPVGNSRVWLSPDVAGAQVLSLRVGEMERGPAGSHLLSLMAASKAVILLGHFWKLAASLQSFAYVKQMLGVHSGQSYFCL